jgi:hypothetical protein
MEWSPGGPRIKHRHRASCGPCSSLMIGPAGAASSPARNPRGRLPSSALAGRTASAPRPPLRSPGYPSPIAPAGARAAPAFKPHAGSSSDIEQAAQTRRPSASNDQPSASSASSSASSTTSASCPETTRAFGHRQQPARVTFTALRTRSTFRARRSGRPARPCAGRRARRWAGRPAAAGHLAGGGTAAGRRGRARSSRVNGGADKRANGGMANPAAPWSEALAQAARCAAPDQGAVSITPHLAPWCRRPRPWSLGLHRSDPSG